MNHSRTLFLTGASGGLGRAIAEAALANGHRVTLTARNPSATGRPPTAPVCRPPCWSSLAGAEHLVVAASRQRNQQTEAQPEAWPVERLPPASTGGGDLS